MFSGNSSTNAEKGSSKDGKYYSRDKKYIYLTLQY